MLASNAIADTAAGTTTGPALGAAPDPYRQRARLLGLWFGERTDAQGVHVRWVLRLDGHGTYRRDYEIIDAAGQRESRMETGQWGHAGSVLFTLQRGWSRAAGDALERADPANPYSSDAYELLEIKRSQLRVRHLSTGREFDWRRVDEAFARRLRP